MATSDGPDAARLRAKVQFNEMVIEVRTMGDPTPEALAAVQQEAKKQVDFYAAWVDLLGQVEAVEKEIAEGRKSAQSGRWLAADDAFTIADVAITKLAELDAPLAAHLPTGFNVVANGAEVARLRASIAAPVASETKRVGREEAVRAAKAQREEAKRKAQEAKEANYAALCGEKPEMGGWGGGEVIGLERALKETAHDPDSIDVDKCTQPIMTEGNCWLVTCNVRGKTGFGGLRLERKTFAYSKPFGFHPVQ